MENDLKIEVNIKRVIDSWRDKSSELGMKIRWKKNIIKFIIRKHLLGSGIQKNIEWRYIDAVIIILMKE